MKKIFIYLFLFIFHVPCWADDITNFQINEFSVKDTVLDYISESKIQKDFYPGNEYYRVILAQRNSTLYRDSKPFDIIFGVVKKDDKKYIIESLEAFISYKIKDFKNCVPTKRDISKDISNLFPDVSVVEKTDPYPNDMGTTKKSHYKLEKQGFISVACFDMTENSGKIDSLVLSIVTTKFSDYLKKTKEDGTRDKNFSKKVEEKEKKSMIHKEIVKNFQIEGISIGDSLLEHFTEFEIKLEQHVQEDHNKYLESWISNTRFKLYDVVYFTYRKDDKNYKLYSIAGLQDYDKAIKECFTQKDKISSEISNMLNDTDVSKDKQKIKHPKGGFVYTDTFLFDSSDMILVQCYDFSKRTDVSSNLRVMIVSEKYP